MKKIIQNVVFLKEATVFIIFIILVFCSFHACANNDDTTGNPQLTPYSEEIYLSGGWLYYDGPRRDAGLFAYNLKTGEKEKITKQQGTLVKTTHGFFYNAGMKVYQINGLSLTLLCVIPKETQLVDYVSGKVYWRKECEALYAGNIDAAGIVSEESVKQLYRRADGGKEQYLQWVKIADDAGYLGRGDGLYFLDFQTLETKCILKGDAYGPVQSMEEEYLFVHSDAEATGLYMVSLKDHTVQKIADTKADFALVFDGMVYYNSNGGTMAYDLQKKSSERLGDSIWSGAAAVEGRNLVMRHWTEYDIYLFDLMDGTLKRLIEIGRDD